MIKGHHLRELFRYLVYVSSTPGDLVNLALTCKMSAELVREYTPYKKAHLSREWGRYKVLPNGLVHGYVPGKIPGVARYFINGRCMWWMNLPTIQVQLDEYEHTGCGRWLVMRSDRGVVLCHNLETHAKIHLFKCFLCDRYHYVEFWFGHNVRTFALYRASCLDKKCQLYLDVVFVHSMMKCYDYESKRSYIARAIINYAKKIKSPSEPC